ncbi:MAG: hypothetical protein GDA44_11155 [Prochloron sp. SP5CPC1]|nr:hypothetical protein [Candidatus Paraprochloron terpiosi SP5CPC1]
MSDRRQRNAEEIDQKLQEIEWEIERDEEEQIRREEEERSEIAFLGYQIFTD